MTKYKISTEEYGLAAEQVDTIINIISKESWSYYMYQPLGILIFITLNRIALIMKN